MAKWSVMVNDTKFMVLDNGDLVAENAVIGWRNFSGIDSQTGRPDAKRTFTLCLNEEWAVRLKQQGWNVRSKADASDEDDILYTTDIVVNMGSMYPPKIIVLEKKTGTDGYTNEFIQTRYNEDRIGELDKMAFGNVDVVIHPYEHGRRTPTGSTIKGYLKTLYITKRESHDYLADKYDAMMSMPAVQEASTDLPF